ncbi:MAG: ATP-binding protein [Anaerolineae bacterium]|nr:ATP-binding protein [Anaerolineae bacterium]MDW8173782.1 ATP-binding protein [Anaerolineae bacterium]
MGTAAEALNIVFILWWPALAAWLLRRRDAAPLRRRVLLVYLLLNALLSASAALPFSPLAERLAPELLRLGLIGLVWVVFGWIVLHDGERLRVVAKKLSRLWMALLALGLLLSLTAGFLDAAPFLGWADWGRLETLPLSGVVALGSLLLPAAALSLLLLRWFYAARLAEVANRAAFWVQALALLLAASLLLGSGSSLLILAGQLPLLLTAVAVLHASYRLRLPDARAQIVASAQSAILLFVLWSLLFGAFYLTQRLELPIAPSSTALLALLALLTALLFLALSALVRAILKSFLDEPKPSAAYAIAQYSQEVASASQLEEVANAAKRALAAALGVRQSALILVGNTFRVPEAVELVMPANPQAPTAVLSKRSPIYRTLVIAQVPLGQADLLYDPLYQSADPAERTFFARLGLQVYAPIISEGRVIGLLAVGDKGDGAPFYRPDLEVLIVIGQQIGLSLRSARLIDDLQHLNRSMRELNKRLDAAKRELEKLDSVKTDFITIASHELRTPLAQIRGYTDILDSLNEQQLLQKGQATQMVMNLRRSTERMEELIGAMLDVSQLDVNSMDLRFVRTTPETVIRMALDPLRDAVEQRKLIIERQGFTGLPHIQADMQRLVQAFRNLILNAIKFTPDGGRIDLMAQLEKADEGGVDTILFTIKDQGVGIAAKDLPYIFHKFYRGFDTQLHSTGVYKFLGAGPGLGLTIAKGIIEGHGGTIWAESPGHDLQSCPGATFYVRLPVIPPQGNRVALPFDEVMAEGRRRTAEMMAVGSTTVVSSVASDDSTRQS